MNRRWMTSILLGALMAPLPSSAGAYALFGSVLGNGGGTASNGSNRLAGTVGQPLIGICSNATYVLCSGYWCPGAPGTVGVRPLSSAELPDLPALGRPRPNPARSAVTFEVALPEPAVVAVKVLDIQGREVAVVDPGWLPAGRHLVDWDGLDATGRPVGTGMYFLRLTLDGHASGERRVVMRR